MDYGKHGYEQCALCKCWRKKVDLKPGVDHSAAGDLWGEDMLVCKDEKWCQEYRDGKRGGG